MTRRNERSPEEGRAAARPPGATPALTPAERDRLGPLVAAAGHPAAAFEALARLRPPPPGADPLRHVLELATAAHAAGHHALAVGAAREAMRRAPDRGEPVFRLCAFLLEAGAAEAGALLAQAQARFPARAEGWRTLGEVLLRKGRKAAALVCLARGAPDAALALRCGLLARELGRRQDARDAFAEAAALAPQAPRPWFLLGTAAQDLRDFAGAAQAYRAALARAPDLAEAAVNLGTVLQAMGDLDGAKAAYGRALRLRADTFGRIAQALPGEPRGELWLDLAALRRRLVAG